MARVALPITVGAMVEAISAARHEPYFGAGPVSSTTVQTCRLLTPKRPQPRSTSLLTSARRCMWAARTSDHARSSTPTSIGSTTRDGLPTTVPSFGSSRPPLPTESESVTASPCPTGPWRWRSLSVPRTSVARSSCQLHLRRDGSRAVLAGTDPGVRRHRPRTHTLDPAERRGRDHRANHRHHRRPPLGPRGTRPELEEIARRHGLTLMFDAAHAFGCTRNGVQPSVGMGAPRCSASTPPSSSTPSRAVRSSPTTTSWPATCPTDAQLRLLGLRQRHLPRHQRQDDRDLRSDGPDEPAGSTSWSRPTVVPFERYDESLAACRGLAPAAGTGAEQLPVRRGRRGRWRRSVGSTRGGPARAASLLHAGTFGRKSTGCNRRSLPTASAVDLPNIEWVADRVLVLRAGPVPSLKQIRDIAANDWGVLT